MTNLGLGFQLTQSGHNGPDGTCDNNEFDDIIDGGNQLVFGLPTNFGQGNMGGVDGKFFENNGVVDIIEGGDQLGLPTNFNQGTMGRADGTVNDDGVDDIIDGGN